MNTKVISFPDLNAVIKKFYNFDAWWTA